jgi:hypothetical protein
MNIKFRIVLSLFSGMNTGRLAMDNLGMKYNVKNWYKVNFFKSDDSWKKINPEITFDDLKENIPNICEMLNITESHVRDRILHELSNRMNVNHSKIYKEWLYG